MAVSLHVSIVRFNVNSYIMVEGKQDLNASFFIILEGKVRITNKDYHSGDSSEESIILEKGDFFGLISCMSGHPREETAQSFTESVLIQIKKDEFGALIQNNAQIALKIIRSFSNRLRRLDLKNMLDTDPENLYQIANFYYSQNQSKQALYIYMKYIEYCPNGNNLNEAQSKVRNLSSTSSNILDNQETNGLIKKIKDNSVIFCEYERGKELFILQKGQVKIVKFLENKEKVLAILNSGDIFGEMAILDDKPRIATAIALGDVEMMAVNDQNFQAMVISQPTLATKLITVLSERLWVSYRQIASDSMQSPVGRLFDALLLQVQKERIPITKGTFHRFNFGPRELVGMVGLSINEGKLAVAQMLKNKKFKLSDGNKVIECLDLEELQKEVDVICGMEKREAERKKSKEKR